MPSGFATTERIRREYEFQFNFTAFRSVRSEPPCYLEVALLHQSGALVARVPAPDRYGARGSALKNAARQVGQCDAQFEPAPAHPRRSHLARVVLVAAFLVPE